MQTRFTDQPTVDVMIPNYNYGHYLLECADSVLSQTGINVRLLIIDNASKDNSAAIARDLAAHDKRVELLLRSKMLGRMRLLMKVLIGRGPSIFLYYALMICLHMEHYLEPSMCLSNAVTRILHMGQPKNLKR